MNEAGGLLGPSGSGVLAVMAFQPIGNGTSDLTLVGIDEAYKSDLNPTKRNYTSLGLVEQCAGEDCQGINVEFIAGTGIVLVEDPAVATATALPPTPTPQPRAATTPNRAATVAAALGTPERTLGQTGSTTTGTTASDTAGAAGTAAGPDGVVGTADDGQPASGGPGGVNALPAGSRITTQGGSTGAVAGAAAGARGPNGAPIAGYGPQVEQNPWPGRAGAAMIIIGATAVLGGAAIRGRRPQAE